MSEKKWTEIVKADHKWGNLGLRETFQYWDLIILFVRRDLIAQYKQTILGPLWIIIQPLITSLVFTFIFGTVAGIPVGEIPHFLYYMSGLVCWKYFEECIKKTSNVFINNSGIFGKVYFPRLTVPVSIIITGLAVFLIQFVMFGIFFAIYYFNGEFVFEFSGLSKLVFLPFLILNIACIGFGTGLIISSLTTKYMDLRYLIDFGVQLLMYMSPVIMPIALLKEKGGILGYIAVYNPLSPLIEFFRTIFFDVEFDPSYLLYSGAFGIGVLILGIMIFNKVERNFMDTI